jgi:hypothetical protein
MPAPNLTKLELFNGSIDLANDTIKVALYNDTTAFTFDPDTHEFVSDILDGGTTAQEFGGSGYSRKTLANQATSQDNTDDEAVFDADDLSWSSIDGETIQGIIIYRQVGTDDTTPADDDVITVKDDTQISDFPLDTNGGEVNVSFDSEGIITLQ